MPPRIVDRRSSPERPGAGRDRARGGGARGSCRGCGRPPTSSRAGTSPPPSRACSTSRCRPPAVVFCRTTDEVDPLTETLNGTGYRAEALHGGMDQQQRDRVMGRLPRRQPRSPRGHRRRRARSRRRAAHARGELRRADRAGFYVHRIGRIGRAGREGTAITLVEPREHRMLRAIERATKQKIEIETVPDGRRPARPAPGADARGRCGSACWTAGSITRA